MLLSRLKNGLECSVIAGAVGASMGGCVVAGIGAIGGSTLGPVGTFFGLTVGKGAGAAVGGMIGSVGGFIGGVIENPNGRLVEQND